VIRFFPTAAGAFVARRVDMGMVPDRELVVGWETNPDRLATNLVAKRPSSTDCRFPRTNDDRLTVVFLRQVSETS
jgi:hypothetical protein